MGTVCVCVCVCACGDGRPQPISAQPGSLNSNQQSGSPTSVTLGRIHVRGVVLLRHEKGPPCESRGGELQCRVSHRAALRWGKAMPKLPRGSSPSLLPCRRTSLARGADVRNTDGTEETGEKHASPSPSNSKGQFMLFATSRGARRPEF